MNKYIVLFIHNPGDQVKYLTNRMEELSIQTILQDDRN